MFALIFLSNLDRERKKNEKKQNEREREKRRKKKPRRNISTEFITSGRMQKKNPRNTFITRMYATTPVIVRTFCYYRIFFLPFPLPLSFPCSPFVFVSFFLASCFLCCRFLSFMREKKKSSLEEYNNRNFIHSKNDNRSTTKNERMNVCKCIPNHRNGNRVKAIV